MTTTTLQHGSIDIAARPTLRVILNVPAVTAAALKEDGIEAPPHVAIVLREATKREERWYEQQIELLKTASNVRDAEGELVATILAKRVEDETTDPAVLRELALDMSETVTAQVLHGFITGRLEDPKVLSGAVQQMKKNLTRLMLTEMAAAEL